MIDSVRTANVLTVKIIYIGLQMWTCPAKPQWLWGTTQNRAPDLDILSKGTVWTHRYLMRMMKYFELMTEEINKQVFQRLQHAEKYVELDEDTHVYTMGRMSEAMKERFRTMILIYRDYTQYGNYMWDSRYHVIARQVSGLQEIEGEYNRLLHERRLYHKAMQGFYEELTYASKLAYEATKMREDTRGRRSNARTPQVRDEDYKLQLRMQKFEEKRASFNPEVEGIDVDLGDMVRKK